VTEAPLNIGIDGRALVQPLAGVGRYVLELCKALDTAMPSARFFVYSPAALRLPVQSDRWTLRNGYVAPRGFKAAYWLTYAFRRLSRSDPLDIFWYGTGIMPLIALSARIKTVLTVHDLNHKIVPHTMDRKGLWIHRALFGRSVTRASAVTTNSAGTAQRLRIFYHRSANAVVPPGVSPEFRPRAQAEVSEYLRKHSLTEPFLLAVGTREPRKNLTLLIDTFLQMKAEALLPRHTLVLVGARGWRSERLERLLDTSTTLPVRQLGYVPDEDLSALYAGCDALIFPSMYEGFGIPVAEARACGARVVATDIPETREAGDSATIYIPATESGIRSGILSALSATKNAAPGKRTDWASSARILARVFTSL
jgi:glycosyltransferase involved in cell wall biosynthesis